MDRSDEGVFTDHGVEDFGHRDGRAGFVGSGLTEAVGHDALHIEGRMVGRVVALYGACLLFGEPIALAVLQLSSGTHGTTPPTASWPWAKAAIAYIY